MPRARRSTTYRRKVKRSTTTRKPVEVKPKMPVAELRKKLDGFQKEIKVEIPISALEGSLVNVTKRLKHYATTSEIKGAWTIKKGSKQTGRYNYTTEQWYLIGARPYTDKELEVEGPKLLAVKERKEKKAKVERDKKLTRFNELASQLGLPNADELSK